ncbi:MAG: helix-turn-helix domain-containing protein [Marinicellaceae bacterium]
MKINTERLIAEKTKRAWTQGHLAEVCGVSLRTIQRLEKTGAASNETIKALASVFELSIEELMETQSTKPIINKEFIGKVILPRIALLLLLILPFVSFFFYISGAHLMLDITELNEPRRTVSSSSALLLLFKDTNFAHYTLLPAILLFSISIIRFANDKVWVKVSLIFSCILFLGTSTIFSVIVFISALVIFFLTRKNQSILSSTKT